MTASGEPRFGAGTPVEVRNHFHGTWSRGFFVTDVSADGYRLARGDGTPLPVCVDPSDVRPAAPAAERDAGELRVAISLDLRTPDDIVTVRVNGPLIRATAARFHEETRQVGGLTVLVDLSSVSVIDDAGGAVLLALLHRCREHHGNVLVAAIHPGVRRVLQQLGVHRVAALIDGATTPLEPARTGSAGRSSRSHRQAH